MKRVYGRVAILYPATQTTGQKTKVDNDLFAGLFRALADKGIQAEPTAYHDGLYAEVKQQLLAVDGVLVWVNPIEAGRDRTT